MILKHMKYPFAKSLLFCSTFMCTSKTVQTQSDTTFVIHKTADKSTAILRRIK